MSSLFHTDFGAEGTVGWTDDDDDVDGCDGDTMIQSMKKKKRSKERRQMMKPSELGIYDDVCL